MSAAEDWHPPTLTVGDLRAAIASADDGAEVWIESHCCGEQLGGVTVITAGHVLLLMESAVRNPHECYDCGSEDHTTENHPTRGAPL